MATKKDRKIAKRPKIALLSLFLDGGEGSGKKTRKIALLSLYLLYLYHV